jgi:predicted ester cyclase
MSVQQNKDDLRRFIQATLVEGNQAVVDEFVTPDTRIHVDIPIPNLPPTGAEVMRAMMSWMRNAFPDLHYTLEAEVGEGDKVIQFYTGRGTNLGNLGPSPASGKTVTWPEYFFAEFADGKLRSLRADPDRMSILQQIGAIPPPPRGH